ncbi:MAG: hypothetical protein NUV35_09730, partial [Syntrophomonadaceae bacterium]|nr:hypothetical protein [Syntrophomonadaceae bacterium]
MRANILRHEFKMHLRSVITWSAAIALLILVFVSLFSSFAEQAELMNLMRETRCIYLYLGLESVNPATLESYHKSQTVEDIAEAVRVIHKHKISVHGMFVLGSDEDEVSTLK